MKKTVTFELGKFDALIEDVLTWTKSRALPGATVVALHGDLGAGKTTFVKALGERLGVNDIITSPTFTIMKGYETTDSIFAMLVHMDAYRIESVEELRPLRFSELLTTPQTLFCIEWAERIERALPKDLLNLTFSIVDETTRTVQISA